MSKSDDYFSTPSKPSARPLKVGEAIRHALSEIFLRGETHVYELDNASITVSEVRVAPDLKNATAFIMPLAGGNKETVMRTLSDAAPHIRYLVSKKVELRYMPRIQYKLDASYDEAHRINTLLNDPSVKRDLSNDSTPDEQ